MIVSASRRTDIPAFYSEWLINRLKEGFALVRNPFNPHHLSRINLGPMVVDFIVFWTKNPDAMLSKLDRIDSFHVPYYFLFTITPYDNSLEKNLPSKIELINTFKRLSERIGKQRVLWRYDPVLLTDKIDVQYHFEHFKYLCERLENYTERCIVSFIHLYKKSIRNLRDFKIIAIDNEKMIEISGQLSRISAKYGISLQICSPQIDLSGTGIKAGKCIDDDLIADITGFELDVKKDKYQRRTCRCVESVDIGSYNTCLNGCLYCYANLDLKIAEKYYKEHDPKSHLLYGHIKDSDRIVERDMKSVIEREKTLFSNKKSRFKVDHKEIHR